MYSFLVAQPWFLGWRDQCADHRARSRLNGHLAQAAMAAEAYPVPYPDIHPENGASIFKLSEGGVLSQQGNFYPGLILIQKSG